MSGNPFSSFAEKLAGKLFGEGGKFSLTAFGKHPGWDDHIYDLRVDSEALVAVRQYLYTDGIGSIIDSGDWERLSENELLAEFDHALFWIASGDLVVGRIWSSSDGKGRTRYPMILCAHLSGSQPVETIGLLLLHLEQIELACKATPTADGVRQALDAGGEKLLEAIKNNPPPLPNGQIPLSGIHFEDSREELMRACYAIQSQLGAAGNKSPKNGQHLDLRLNQLEFFAQHIRLPAGLSDPAQTVLFWQNIIRRLAPTEVPLLFLVPRGLGFLDLIAGKPGAAQLVCLRETEAKIPCASIVPYELTEEFKTSIATLLA